MTTNSREAFSYKKKRKTRKRWTLPRFICGGELEKIGLVPLSSKDLKAMQAHIKKANHLNSTLVKAGKVF